MSKVIVTITSNENIVFAAMKKEDFEELHNDTISRRALHDACYEIYAAARSGQIDAEQAMLQVETAINNAPAIDLEIKKYPNKL